MKSVVEDIKKGSFKPVYLFYGEEAYLKQQYKNRLKDAVLPEGDTINLSIYSGKGIDVEEMIAQADTMPFFAEHRLLLIEDSGFFKNANQQLADYIPSIPEGTIMLFVESEVDKRGKLYKAVNKKGSVVEFTAQNEQTLTRWILGILKSEKKMITSGAMKQFLEKTGTDMERIRQELEKLICYCMEKESITEEDVAVICSEQTENKIFDMINAMAEKKQKKAMELYYDLLALKEPPMRILYLLARQFNGILQVKESLMRGNANAQIAREMGVAPFIVGKYAAQAKYFESAQIKEALRDFAETEEAVKTGKIEDKLGVELMIIKYSQK